MGVLDLNSSETENATMRADCEPAAIQGTVCPRRRRSAPGTTRKTQLLPPTPLLGRKLPDAARITTTPYTAHQTGTGNDAYHLSSFCAQTQQQVEVKGSRLLITEGLLEG